MLDEIVITKSTFLRADLTIQKIYHLVDFNAVDTKVIAVLAAVSREYGMDHYMTFNKSVKIKKFSVFLDEIRSKYPFDDMMIIMDNLSVHRSLIVRDRCDELGYEIGWTPPYSPQYSGIEGV